MLLDIYKYIRMSTGAQVSYCVDMDKSVILGKLFIFY